MLLTKYRRVINNYSLKSQLKLPAMVPDYFVLQKLILIILVYINLNTTEILHRYILAQENSSQILELHRSSINFISSFTRI